MAEGRLAHLCVNEAEPETGTRPMILCGRRTKRPSLGICLGLLLCAAGPWATSSGHARPPQSPIGGTQFSWAKVFGSLSGGPVVDAGADCAFDGLGNLVVAAGRGTVSGRVSFNVSKFRPSGAGIFTSWFPGTGAGEDHALAVLGDAAQDTVAVGYQTVESLPAAPAPLNGGVAHRDAFAVKLNPAGAQLWTFRHNEADGDDQLNALAQDRDGNLLVVGTVTGLSTGTDLFAAKLRGADGVAVWTRIIDSTAGLEAGTAVAILPATVMGEADDVIVGGVSGAASTDAYVTRLDGDTGVPVWAVTAGSIIGPDPEALRDLAVDSAGDVFAAGSLRESASNRAAAVLKLRGSDGAQLFRSTFNGAIADGFDEFSAVAVNPSGDTYAFGRTQGAGAWDSLLVRLSGSTGVPSWSRMIPGVFIEEPVDGAGDLELDSAGRPHVALRLSSTGDFEAARFNTVGDLDWRRRFDGPDGLRDRAASVALDAQGNVGLAGTSESAVTLTDLAAGYVDCRAPTIGPCSATPAMLPASGGTAVVDVTLTDNVGVSGARVRMTDPAANVTLIGLTPQGDDIYQAQLTLPPNTGMGDALFNLEVEAQDATGNSVSMPCGTVRVLAPPDVTPPTITGCTVDPRRLTSAGGVVSVRTQVSDDRGVASVVLDVESPGGVVNSHPMTPDGKDGFDAAFSVPAAGGAVPRVYVLTLVARDAAGNTANGSCPSVVQDPLDTTPPAVSNCSVAPTDLPPAGGAVTLQAVVRDDIRLAGVRMRIRLLPEGPENLIDLAAGKGDDFIGFFNAPANPNPAPQRYSTRLEARDAAGNATGLDCADVVVRSSDVVPPVISDITVTPDTHAAGGGASLVRARVLDAGVVDEVHVTAGLGTARPRPRGLGPGILQAILVPIGGGFFEGMLPFPPNAGGTRQQYNLQILARDAAGNQVQAAAGQVTVLTPGRLRVSTRELDFGLILLNQEASRTFTIRNVGDGPLAGLVGLLPPPFRLLIKEGKAAPSPAGTTGDKPYPYLLQPGEVITGRVDFVPTEHSRYRESLVITSDDPAKKSVKIIVRGLGCRRR